MAAQVQTSLFDRNLYIVELPTKKEKKERNRYNRWKNFYVTEKYDYTTYHNFCIDVWDKNVLINNIWLCLKAGITGDFINALFLYFLFVLPVNYGKDERKFREWFYILDDEGYRQPLGDINHIYRYETIYKIKRKIYNQIFSSINIFERDVDGNKIEEREIYGLRAFYREFASEDIWTPKWVDYGAEIKGSEMLPIKDRVLLHIRLLRNLRKGLSVAQASRECKAQAGTRLLRAQQEEESLRRLK